jgi:hypothetical protein
MRDVRLELEVDSELEDARQQWARLDDAWGMIEWVLMRDPTVGEPQTESGRSRSFVFRGSVAHEMPDIQVIYVFDDNLITVKSIRIGQPAHAGGHA